MKFFTGGKNESQVLIVQHDIGGQNGVKIDDSGATQDRSGGTDPSSANNFYTNYLSNRLSFENGVMSGVGAFSRFFFMAQYFAARFINDNISGGFRTSAVDPRELSANHLANLNKDGSVDRSRAKPKAHVSSGSLLRKTKRVSLRPWRRPRAISASTSCTTTIS